MRSIADRIRHATSFELLALLIIVPAGILLFDHSWQDLGVVALAGSLLATLWVYVYSYVFDLALLKLQGHTNKTLTQRVVYAVLFEVSFLLVFLPFIVWHLNISVLDALIMDAGFAAFYVLYSFAFNWLYDLLFPVDGEPVMIEPQTEA